MGEPVRISAARPRTNAAPRLSRFIGRDALLAAIEARIAAGERLITLLGPPGSGKTRLALRFAELALEEPRRALWAGGVFVLELTEASTAADLIEHARAELGGGATRTPEQFLPALGRVLLVLDNFEQLEPGAALEVARWCRAAPELRVVITSRMRVEVEGETILEIGPLAGDEAIRLFEDRARAAGAPVFGDDELREVSALVQELDGLPLAIELAAARARVLGPRELRARLDDRFRLLARKARGARDRHSTLEAAILASWDQLSRDEQAALASCSVFAGSFSLEAAAYVIERDRDATLELLEALASRSLVELVRSNADTRFRLLVSIRAFAKARLEDHPAVAARHRAYYAAEARPRGIAVARTGDAAARAWLLREKENLVRASNDASAEELVELVLALDHVSLDRPGDDRARIATVAIDRARAAKLDDGRIAQLLVTRGVVRGTHGLAEAAVEDFEAAASLARGASAPAVEGEALVYLAVRWRQRGRFDLAQELGERALERLAGTDHPRIEAQGLACLGLLHGELDRAELAKNHDERALAMFRALGDRASEGLALGNLAELAQAAGDFDRADRCFAEALEAFAEVEDIAYQGMYTGFRANLFFETARFGEARALYERADTFLARAGVRHVRAIVLGAAAALEAADDRIEDAERVFAQADAALALAEVAHYRSAIELHKGQLDLARARRAIANGQAKQGEVEIARAKARLSEAKHADLSSGVRLAKRLLSAALERCGGTATLRISSDGAWFEIAGGSRVDLSKRKSLGRVLVALLDQRRRAPERALDRDQLVASGWPGERIQTEAASTRLRVAIATLRSRGLGRAIVTRDDGYLLDPALSIAVVAADQGQSIVIL